LLRFNGSAICFNVEELFREDNSFVSMSGYQVALGLLSKPGRWTLPWVDADREHSCYALPPGVGEKEVVIGVSATNAVGLTTSFLIPPGEYQKD